MEWFNKQRQAQNIHKNTKVKKSAIKAKTNRNTNKQKQSPRTAKCKKLKAFTGKQI